MQIQDDAESNHCVVLDAYFIISNQRKKGIDDRFKTKQPHLSEKYLIIRQEDVHTQFQKVHSIRSQNIGCRYPIQNFEQDCKTIHNPFRCDNGVPLKEIGDAGECGSVAGGVDLIESCMSVARY